VEILLSQIHKRSAYGVPTLSFLEQANTFAVGEQKMKFNFIEFSNKANLGTD